jgi:hypothetical protein
MEDAEELLTLIAAMILDYKAQQACLKALPQFKEKESTAPKEKDVVA